jgi:transportin-1
MVIKHVCQGLVMVLEVDATALEDQMSALIQFMMKCTQCDDAFVALEACEFWLALAEQDSFYDHLEPYLGQ